ncbi:MAG: hypothetical protein ACTSPB_26600 [Candidatus Thorarchaeota archaeon]
MPDEQSEYEKMKHREDMLRYIDSYFIQRNPDVPHSCKLSGQVGILLDIHNDGTMYVEMFSKSRFSLTDEELQNFKWHLEWVHFKPNKLLVYVDNHVRLRIIMKPPDMREEKYNV